LYGQTTSAIEEKFECPKTTPNTPNIARSDVYKDVPFKAGEKAVYQVTWSGIMAGYGTLEVQSPQKHNGVWHRVFHADGETGDWFKNIFVARDQLMAFSRPWDFAISKFYIEQEEGKLFSKSFVQKKWLDFDHINCKVREKVERPDKPVENKEFDLHQGAADALGIVYMMRTWDFKLNEPQKAMIYTSEKNWWLEAKPVAISEEVKVEAGTFNTTKLKLQTYIGKELQQKGDVFVWISNKAPRQLVQVQGEIKIGSVWMKLSKFTPGS
jgi:hypothetical protein